MIKYICAVVATAVLCVGCGKKAETPKAAMPASTTATLATKTATLSPPSIPVESPHPASMPAQLAQPATPAQPPLAQPAPPVPASTAPAPTDPLAAKLIGTTWQVGKFNVTFKDSITAQVKGGPLQTLAPNGADARYTLKNGEIAISVMGQTFKGTWDGEKLIVSGDEGVKQ